MWLTDDIPERVHTWHDTDEQGLDRNISLLLTMNTETDVQGTVMQLLHQQTRIARSNRTFPKSASTSYSDIHTTSTINPRDMSLTTNFFLPTTKWPRNMRPRQERQFYLRLCQIHTQSGMRRWMRIRGILRVTLSIVCHLTFSWLLLHPLLINQLKKKSHGSMKGEGNESEECGESETKDKQWMEHIGGQVP